MYVYGRNVAKELIKEKNKKIKFVILQENFQDKELISLLKSTNLPIKIMKRREMDNLVGEENQGIILSIEDYKYQPLESMNLNKEDCLLLLLDHIEDPHNLGAIIRTSEAAGVDGIIIPKDRAAKVNATVMKTSAGALPFVKLAEVSNLNQTIEILKKKGFWIVGTSLTEESVDYDSIDYKGKIALVIGNEGKGISRLVQENCDFIAKIPMFGEINSLNASVATGIMIYEVIRSRKR